MQHSRMLWLYTLGPPGFIFGLASLSLLELGLGLLYADELNHTGMGDDGGWEYEFPSTSRIIGYCCTVPIVSTIYAIIDAAVYVRVKDFRREIFAIVGAVLLSFFWLAQVIVWGNCEESPRDDSGFQNWCPQYKMFRLRGESKLIPQSDVSRAKFAFGIIALFGYVGYMILVATIIGKVKVARRGRVMENYENDEGASYPSEIELRETFKHNV